MALIPTGPNQDASQVARALRDIAKELGEPGPITETSGPRIAFIVEEGTGKAWIARNKSPQQADDTTSDADADESGADEPDEPVKKTAKKATRKKKTEGDQ